MGEARPFCSLGASIPGPRSHQAHSYTKTDRQRQAPQTSVQVLAGAIDINVQNSLCINTVGTCTYILHTTCPLSVCHPKVGPWNAWPVQILSCMHRSTRLLLVPCTVTFHRAIRTSTNSIFPKEPSRSVFGPPRARRRWKSNRAEEN